MEKRIVLALAEPALRRAAAAALLREADVIMAYGYDHTVELVRTVHPLHGVVVDTTSWDGRDVEGLVAEARRHRPDVGITLVVTRPDDVADTRDTLASAICWAPWQPGDLGDAISRAAASAPSGATLRFSRDAH